MSILIDKTGPITVLTVNRPHAANSITMDMAHDIQSAILDFNQDASAHVLVVTGRGDRTFSAGGDVPSLLDVTSHDHIHASGPLGFARLVAQKPTIAAVNGHCYGGGMELALWCDVRVASTNAMFGALNRQWGVTLIDGATQRLPRIVGLGNALWMINTGYRVTCERAFEMGLVQEVVPEGTALERAMELARELSELPQSALRADRLATLASPGQSMESGLNYEALVGRAVMHEPDVIARLEEERARQAAK